MDNKELEKNTPEKEEVKESTTPVTEVKEEKVVVEQPAKEPVAEQPTTEDKTQQEVPVEENKVEEEIIPDISLNGSEQVVFEYKPPKEYGIWPFLIFFLLVGGIIVFLPYIQNFISEYKNGQIVIKGNNQNNNNSTVDNNKEQSTEDEKYYELQESTVISINKLTIDKMKKEILNNSYYLSLNVTNKDNKYYDFSDKVYIELYNENKTLLSRLLLENDTMINASSSSEVSIKITEQVYNSATKIIIKTINTDSYPQITLAENLKDQQTLTCTLNDRSILYTFDAYKLISIDDTKNALRNLYPDDYSYTTELSKYRQKSANYNIISGMSSSLVETLDGFTYVTKIDANSITESSLNSLKERGYYKGNTEAKTISFEMTARGYTCK